MVSRITATFWAAEDEDGIRAPFLACRARDLETCPSAQALNQAFLGLHEGAGLFYFVETDGGFRIVREGDDATCTLELHDGTRLIQLVVPADWASLALETGGAMMVIARGETDPARLQGLTFPALADADVEVLSFCAKAA